MVKNNEQNIWSRTPSNIAGYIVLGVLIILIGVVFWSGLKGHFTSLRYFIAGMIGFVISGKILYSKKLRLDSERVITGWLAFWVCVNATILAISATIFAFMFLL